MTLGVPSAGQRINISGITTTAIGYAGTSDQAKTDLSLAVGLGECGANAVTIPVGIDAAVKELACNGEARFTNFGGVVDSGLRDAITIVDGAITINGKFDGLRNIDAISLGGHLSLESSEVDGVGTSIFNIPFNRANDMMIYSSPERIQLGVVSEDHRISIDGETRTSILYTGSHELAYAGDLQVNLDHAPTVTDGGGGNGNPSNFGPEFVSVVDGYVSLTGTFNELAGLEVRSIGGYLAIETIDVPGVGEVELKTPFPISPATVLENSPHVIVLGVLGAQNRISIEGTTKTSIRFTGPSEIALRDITVNVGLGDNPPRSFPVVPEPASSCLLTLGGLTMLMVRGRRRYG